MTEGEAMNTCDRNDIVTDDCPVYTDNSKVDCIVQGYDTFVSLQYNKTMSLSNASRVLYMAMCRNTDPSQLCPQQISPVSIGEAYYACIYIGNMSRSVTRYVNALDPKDGLTVKYVGMSCCENGYSKIDAVEIHVIPPVDCDVDDWIISKGAIFPDRCTEARYTVTSPALCERNVRHRLSENLSSVVCRKKEDTTTCHVRPKRIDKPSVIDSDSCGRLTYTSKGKESTSGMVAGNCQITTDKDIACIQVTDEDGTVIGTGCIDRKDKDAHLAHSLIWPLTMILVITLGIIALVVRKKWKNRERQNDAASLQLMDGHNSDDDDPSAVYIEPENSDTQSAEQ